MRILSRAEHYFPQSFPFFAMLSMWGYVLDSKSTKSCKETGLHSNRQFPHSTKRKTVNEIELFMASKENSTNDYSEGWGPPQFQEKRSRSEKAILGALGEFRGILGAGLGIRNSILGIRDSILEVESHDLSNRKTTILGATPGAIPRIDGKPRERFPFAPAFSEPFFENWGGPRAPMITLQHPVSPYP